MSRKTRDPARLAIKAILKSLFFPQDSRSHKTRDLPAAGGKFWYFDGVLVSFSLISIEKHANQELKIKIEISRKTRDPARLAIFGISKLIPQDSRRESCGT